MKKYIFITFFLLLLVFSLSSSNGSVRSIMKSLLLKDRTHIQALNVAYKRLSKDLDNKILKNEVIVNFTAPWCSPCESRKQEINKLAEKNVQVINIDLSESKWTQVFKVEEIPHSFFFKNGSYFKELTKEVKKIRNLF